MASNDKSFEELVNEAPLAPAAGTVSLVGKLAKSSEPGKFVLTLPDGSAMTLDTAAVKGHEVLGALGWADNRPCRRRRRKHTPGLANSGPRYN